MRVMRNKNDWMQKKSIIIILVVLLLVAILAVAAELGMKSGGRPNKIIEKITDGNATKETAATERPASAATATTLSPFMNM